MRRSRIDIMIDILEIARGNALKTKIMYKTNLSFKLTEQYLDWLLKQGLVENRVDKYIITDKGKEVLYKLKDVLPYVSPDTSHGQQ